jgi:hypothetical protein
MIRAAVVIVVDVLGEMWSFVMEGGQLTSTRCASHFARCHNSIP